MSQEQGRRHGDLPVTLLPESFDWVPPKSHDPTEIADFKAAPPGTVITTRENRGIRVARHFMIYVADLDDQIEDFGPSKIAEATYGSAYFGYAKNARGVGRKRTYLPVHSNEGGLITRQSIALEGAQRLTEASETSDALLHEVRRKGSLEYSRRKTLGLQLANTALTIASLPQAERLQTAGEDKVWMQELAHRGMLQMLRGIQETTIHTGSSPSLAQLATPYSPLSSYLHNRGGHQTAEAFEYAQDMASTNNVSEAISS